MISARIAWLDGRRGPNELTHANLLLQISSSLVEYDSAAAADYGFSTAVRYKFRSPGITQ